MDVFIFTLWNNGSARHSQKDCQNKWENPGSNKLYHDKHEQTTRQHFLQMS